MSEMAMPDEALSELAEMLADACRGRTLAPFCERVLHVGACCPLGAALSLKGERYPNPGEAGRALGIPERVAYGFAHGFDGHAHRPEHDDPRAWALGLLFRPGAS